MTHPAPHADSALGISDAEQRLIAVMPLHAITALYNEQGLRARLAIEVARLDGATRQRQVNEALELARRCTPEIGGSVSHA